MIGKHAIINSNISKVINTKSLNPIHYILLVIIYSTQRPPQMSSITHLTLVHSPGPSVVLCVHYQ